MNLKSYKAIISFVRLPNLLLITVFMWFVREFLLKPEFQLLHRNFILTNYEFQLLILDVLLVTLIGYWLNDWADRKIDSINKPHRFLVTHSISSNLFWWIVIAVAAFSLGLSLYLAIATQHLREIWILPVTVLLVSVYAFRLKGYKPIGNILVSLLIVALIGLVMISENLFTPFEFQSPQFLKQVWFFAGLIFLINLAREIIKDVEDLQGDLASAVISIPTRFGVSVSGKIVVCLLFVSLILEILYTLPHLNNGLTISAVTIITLVILTTIASLLRSNNKADFRAISRQLKWIMVFGILQLAAISLS